MDGQVILTSDSGDVFIYTHGKERKVPVKVEAESTFYTGAVYANGTLYIAAEHTLYAVRAPK